MLHFSLTHKYIVSDPQCITVHAPLPASATIAFANARCSSAQRICKHTLNVLIHRRIINVSDSKGNHSVTVTSNNTKLVHWPLMGALLHLVQRGGAWVGCGFAQYSLLAVQPVPNEAAHPSTASVPIAVLLYDSPLLCRFNVAIKGLSCTASGWCVCTGCC